MKIRDPGADAMQCQPAAAPRLQASGPIAQGDAAVGADSRQAAIDQSPRMLAQRCAMDALSARPQRHVADAAVQRMEDALAGTASTIEPDVAVTVDRIGLPKQLRAGLESLSGIDMSAVRVHRNSDKPAQLHALAYAKGNDIHLGPGQEQHLPHEAWHVVQQRQGRVRETTQLAGQGVNDEAGLEAEADRMGRQASVLAPHAASHEREARPAPGGPLSHVEVSQCRMGFEFETGANIFVANPTTGKRFDRKDVAYDNGRCRLEGDSGHHLEFVTEPYDNWTQLEQAIQDARAVADDLAQRAGQAQDGTIVVGTAQNFSEDNISMRIRDPAFTASVQSTEGAALSDLAGLIGEHLQGPVATAINQQTTAAITDARQRNYITQQAQVLPNVQGMILALVMYVHRAQAHSGTSKDGPKAGFRLMARTDFRSMYRSLTATENAQLKLILFGAGKAKNVDNQNNPITQATGVPMNNNLFGSGYMDEGAQGAAQAAVTGPTLRAWLGSIVTAASGRDLLSPPPGYTAHSKLQGDNKKFRYGMGALGMDDDLALFEMRGYRNREGKKPKDQWVAFARAKYNLAGLRNGSLQANVPAQPAGPVNAQQGAVQHGAAQQAPIVAPQQGAPQQVAPQQVALQQVVPQQVVQHLQQQVVAQLPQLPAQPVLQPNVNVQMPVGGYDFRPRKRQRIDAGPPR